MYWLIDIFVVLLLVIAVFRGLKKGFFSTTYDFLGYFITLAFALLLTALFVLLFYKIGAIDQLKIVFIGLIGETGSFMEKVGVTSEKVSYCLALGVVAIIGFIPSYVIAKFIHKGFVNLISDCRENRVFMVIDSTVGVIVNTALVCCSVLAIFAFFHAFNTTNVFVSVDEALRACPISGVIYEHNPINDLIAGTGIQNVIADAINANF